VEDVMPIATGLEREEIEAELQVSPVAAASFLITGYLLVKKIKFCWIWFVFLYRERRDSTWTRPSVPLAPR
jgi:hypothetical protein